MRIGNFEIGGGRCLIVAELGINANGSVEIAKQLIDAAVDAGADAVKFQKRTVEIVYSAEDLARPRESPFGATNGDLKKGLEFNYRQYSEIDAYCREKEIHWFASPWDTESVKFLEQFDLPCYKVASACITDTDLLHAIAKTKKPVIVSTGMSLQSQIDKAINFFPQENLAILCCTSTYPCELKDLRLERLWSMKALYPDIPIGWSHHHVSPWMALCARAMGAIIIEAHLTLDRSSWGTDQSSSLEPRAFEKLITEIRSFEEARGDGTIGIIETEIPILEKLRRVK